jgi:nitrate reductase NapE component
MPEDRRDRTRWLLATAIAVHLVFALSLAQGFLVPLFFEAVHSGGQAGDFFGIYQAGVNFVEGRSIYARGDGEAYGEAFTPVVPYYYFYRYPPPTAAVFGVVSRLLDPWPAYWIWVALNEVLLVLLAARVLALREGTASRRAVAAALWFAFTPFYLEQHMGQFSFLMAALIAAVLFPPAREGADAREEAEAREGEGAPEGPEARRGGSTGGGLGWPRGATVAWGASLALKSYTALFAIPLALRRRWRTLAAGAALAAAAVLPYYIARPDDLAYFLRINLQPFQGAGFSGAYGLHTFLRWIAQTAMGEAGLRKIGAGSLDVAVANVPALAATALVFLSALAVTWRTRAPLRDLFCLWVLTFFLGYKEIWEYHYVMLLPVLTVAFLGTGSRLVTAVWVLLALPTPLILFPHGYDPRAGRWDVVAGFLQFSAKTVPTLVLYVWLWLRLWRARRLAPAISASARPRESGPVR